MNSEIIVALILGISSIITSFFWGFVPNIRKRKIVSLENKILKMVKDISFLYHMEDLLLSELSTLKGESKESLKRKYRSEIKTEFQVEPSENIKPSVFKKEIQKYK